MRLNNAPLVTGRNENWYHAHSRISLTTPSYFVLLCTEEVISSDHTLWWSPDSTKLLFAGFDDSAVKPYSFPIYGGVEQQYDTIDTIAYPKVSQRTIHVHILSCDSHVMSTARHSQPSGQRVRHQLGSPTAKQCYSSIRDPL